MWAVTGIIPNGLALLLYSLGYSGREQHLQMAAVITFRKQYDQSTVGNSEGDLTTCRSAPLTRCYEEIMLHLLPCPGSGGRKSKCEHTPDVCMYQNGMGNKTNDLQVARKQS